MDVSITIPPEAFAHADSENVTSSGRKLTRLQMIGHRKSQLFIPSGAAYSEGFVEHQPVLTAIVTGRRVVNLSSPVVYTIRNLQVRRRIFYLLLHSHSI